MPASGLDVNPLSQTHPPTGLGLSQQFSMRPCDLGLRMFDGQSLTLHELSWDRLDFLCFRFLSQGAAKLPGLAKMTTKVKGLLRGLRYISQMFDEKEQEMQIGLPTDVKHVAHIGWDGPSENPPSWMNEFASPPEALSGTSNSKEVKNLSTDSTLEGQTEKPKHSSRRSSGSASSHLNSPDRRSSDSSKHSRHQASSIIGSPLNSP
ncbi:hypothetical protein OIU78_004372 [Salix suchowensis]|nr:hypothetical protein OIU78_004372 [Salix suchowensis]